MPAKEHALVPLFEKFIHRSYKGKRLKPDGSRIKPQTVANYTYILKHLKDYEAKYQTILRIKIITGGNKRVFMAERNYWKKFYHQFTGYLYQEKNCFDNYVGIVIKTIRVFFNYINKDMAIPTGLFYKNFYICREDVPIVTLMPEQLQFLINPGPLDEKLSKPLQEVKDIFAFGCTVALRVSDLFAIKFTDIEYVNSSVYLPVKTIKTGTPVRIKLPDYAVSIIEKFRATSKKRKTIFPPIPRTKFNAQIKTIAEASGWTDDIGKQRKKRGIAIKSVNKSGDSNYRFCDLVSSHTMRRTAITTMLMLGMKDHVVRKNIWPRGKQQVILSLRLTVF